MTIQHLAFAMLQSRATGDTSDFQLYRYDPSKAAAILFVILFGLTTALHLYQMFRTRTWFMIPFALGGIFEIIGYIGRAMSASQQPGQWTLGPFIMQSILLLISPAFFAASIYMELGRIVELTDGDSLLFIRRRWLTRIFVGGDVLSFLMQGSGGGLMSSSQSSTRATGSNVIVGGLFVQILFFSIFLLAAVLFQTKMRKASTVKASETPWQRHMAALYSTSSLILVRSVFRVVEFIQGFDGYLLRSEVFLYVFDASLMLLVMLVMNWIHPSEIRSLLRGGKFLSGFRVAKSDGVEMRRNVV